MASPREEHRVGAHYLEAVTALLQRVRRAHPTHGLYEAADLQWWWRTPRTTDDVPQLFWFDDGGRAEAAVILTDWSDGVALDPIVRADAPPNLVAHVLERGLSHAARSGFDAVDVRLDRVDDATRDVLIDHGFAGEERPEFDVETWMPADARPAVSPLADGYRRARRLDTISQPHHLVERSGPDVESRLRQTSLYRPDLDVLVVDDRDRIAAYGLFWFDPETGTGLVEPMRTEDEHQRRGLARHILTSGVDLLARAGATRIKICFRPDNPAARDLYLGVGFAPVKETAVLSGPTRRA
jgi:GNAT superfamily N-acetyltransferase